MDTNSLINNIKINVLQKKMTINNIIDKNSTSISLSIKDNYNYNYGTLSSLSLSYSDKIDGSILIFSSGKTKTTFTAPSTIYFYGDSCRKKVFTPIINTRYMIRFFMDNTILCGIVTAMS